MKTTMMYRNEFGRPQLRPHSRRVQAAGLVLLAALVAVTGLMAPPAHAEGPSFARLDDVYGEPRVEIDLGSTMLGLVARVASMEDPAAGAFLSELDHVSVLVYVVGDDAGRALSAADETRDRLAAGGWSPAVSVREDGELVRVFVKERGQVVEGVVVTVVNDREVVFVNVTGTIDPERIGDLMSSLDLDVKIPGANDE